MKRREFVMHTAGMAFLSAIPLGSMAARLPSRGTLLDDPQAWLGCRFRLADGSRLELARIEPVVKDLHSTQLRLHFRSISASMPKEGTHRLSSAGVDHDVFLQAGREGPVACINRLHTVA